MSILENGLRIVRVEETDDMTIGVLLFNNRILCYTLELPYKNNEAFVSSINTGDYNLEERVDWRDSKKLNATYELKGDGLDKRTGILFHPANWVHQLEGCIAPGYRVDNIWCEAERKMLRGVSKSTPAFKMVRDLIAKEKITKIKIDSFRLK